jgi:glycopeptide antibiotics resistance protein
VIHVPFSPVYVILIFIWAFYSFSRWCKKRFGLKRELLVQMLFVYLLLVMKFTFTPFYLNLIYPTRDMNLIPLIETINMLKGARLADALYNIGGNLLMLAYPILLALSALIPYAAYYGVNRQSIVERLREAE